MGITHGKPTTPHELPVVFIHGLGVGLTPYLPFIKRIADMRELFVVELPEVAQTGSELVLPPSAMAEEIAAMLAAHGHSRACFIGHSYGTAVLSWIIRSRPDIVAQPIFLDPICFLLANPDVAYNFIYRRPNNVFMLGVA